MSDGGITFFKTRNLEGLHQFYTRRMGCDLWLDQGKCRIYKRGTWMIGFIQNQESIEAEGILTLFLKDQQSVEGEYSKLVDLADNRPRLNVEYRIYQFFVKDPEGRVIEVQSFEHPIDWIF